MITYEELFQFEKDKLLKRPKKEVKAVRVALSIHKHRNTREEQARLHAAESILGLSE